MTLSEKLELYLQDFTELLAVQQEELGNEGLVDLEAQREDKEEEAVTEGPRMGSKRPASRLERTAESLASPRDEA